MGATATVSVASGASVQMPAGETLTDGGTLSFDDDTVTMGAGCCAQIGTIVVNGTLTATGTTFANSGDGGSIEVKSGGTITPTDSTFQATLFVPYNDVAFLAAGNNLSFGQIEIDPGILPSDDELDLDLIGTDTTNLTYLFPGNFTVDSGAILKVGANVPVQIPAYGALADDVTLTDDGALSFSAGDTVTMGAGCCAASAELVVAGTMTATGTNFINTGDGGSIMVNSDGTITPTDSTFGMPLFVPYNDVASLAAGDNSSFDQIEIDPGTLPGGDELDLDLIGTDTANLSYIFAGDFTVEPGATLDVGANVPVQIPGYGALANGVTLTDDGALSFAAGDTVAMGAGCCAFGGELIVAGTMTATGTTFSNAGDGGSIMVNSGGTITASDSTFSQGPFTLNSGSVATLHFNTFSDHFSINSSTTINIVGNDFSGVGSEGVIATGTSTAQIPLTENYWGTTDPTAIQDLILDHYQAPTTRPTIVFQPFWSSNSGTIASPVTVIYSSSQQNVTLTAAVSTTGGIPISGGTETFTILNSSNQQVGQTTAPANVSNGSVSSVYTLPGGTAVGQYTIEASFSGGGGYPASTDTSQLLTITPAASQVAITSTALNQLAGILGAVTVSLEDSNGNTGATSTTAQTISLGTTSADGTFYASSAGGAALTSVVIPAGQSSVTIYYEDTLAGTPTVTASDSALTSVSSTQQATISPAAVDYFTVTTSYGSPDPAGTAGTVTVTAYDSYGTRDGSGPDQYEGLTLLSSTDLRMSGLPSTYTFTAADAGSHTFTNVILKAAGTQTITAIYSGHSSIAGLSASVDVVPGPVDLVAITGPGGSLVAGTTTAFTVQLEDAYTNPGATSSTAQTIKLSTTSAAGAFYASSTGSSPITSIIISAGQSSITVYYRDTLAGQPTLTASDSALSTPPSQEPVSIVPAAASLVVITSTPLSFVAGGQGPITVQLEDAYHNLGAVSNTAQTIDLTTTSKDGAFYASSTGGTPITFVTIAAGQSSATFYYSDTLAGNPTVTASDGALDSSSMQQETVTPAVAVQVAIVSAPLDLIAGTGGAFTVELLDADGNPGATSAEAQTINLSTTSTLGGFVPTSSGGAPITSVTIPAGKSSATVYYGDDRAGTPTLTASDSAFTTPAATQEETINPSETTHFVVTTGFGSPDTAGTASTVTVTAADQYGNTVGSGPDQYEGMAELVCTDRQESGLPASYMFTAADAGTHTFSDVILGTVGSQTFTATDSVTSSITGASAAIQVAAAKASALAIVTRPPSGIAGGKIGQVVVHANDPYGNLDQTYNGDVTIALATGSIGDLSGTLTMQAIAGVATFNDVVDTVSGSITLAATGTTSGGGTISTGTAGETTIPIAPAAADQFGVTTSFAGTDVAGTSGTVTVEVFDAYGNPVGSAYLGTVDLSSTDGRVSGLPSSYTFTAGDDGSHTFNDVVLETAGSQTITATDSVTGSITETSAAVEVVPAAASQVVIGSAPLTLVAGDSGPLTVQFEDAYDNPGAVSTADQTIGLGTTSAAGAFYATSSGGTAITSITIPAGQISAGFDYEDTRAGTPTVSASDGAFGTTATQQETILPAAPSRVVITSGALDQVAGSLGPVTVQLEDTYSNPGAISTADQTIGLGTTGAAGAFYASGSGGGAIGSVVIAAGRSSATVYYGDTQTGTPTVTASDAAFSSAASTQQETVNPASATHFVVATSFANPDVAGTPGTVTVTAHDTYGNPVGSGPDQYKGTTDLNSSDSRVSGLPASYTFTAADAGSHTFAGVVLETAGSQTITATDSVTSTITGGATVDVVPAAASQAVITGSSSSLIAGTMGPLTVQLEDAYGNAGAVSSSAADDRPGHDQLGRSFLGESVRRPDQQRGHRRRPKLGHRRLRRHSGRQPDSERVGRRAGVSGIKPAGDGEPGDGDRVGGDDQPLQPGRRGNGGYGHGHGEGPLRQHGGERPGPVSRHGGPE